MQPRRNAVIHPNQKKFITVPTPIKLQRMPNGMESVCKRMKAV